MRRAVAAAALAVSSIFPVSFADAVQITDVAPTLGPTAGGATLTVYGTGFSAADNLVLVGGRLCPVTFQSPLVVECTLPALTGASRPIRVIDNGTGEASPPFPFGAVPPTITAVTATSFPTAGGVSLTIDGENFGALDGEHRVVVKGTDICDNLHVEQAHTRVTCTLPAGAGASRSVDITVDGQTSAASSLSYDPPAITAVTPTRAPAAGGTVVTLRGTNFDSASTVTVGGATCPAVSINVNEVSIAFSCVLPPSSGAPPVVVITTGGQSSSPSSSFSYELVASKCNAAKWKAALSLASCIGKAESTAAKKGFPRDGVEITPSKCNEKFDASCAKAETKNDDCSQVGTCEDIAEATANRGGGRKGWDGTIKGRIE